MYDVHVPQRSHLGLVKASPVFLDTFWSSLITCGSLWPAPKTLSDMEDWRLSMRKPLLIPCALCSWITVLTSSVSRLNQVYFGIRINGDPGTFLCSREAGLGCTSLMLHVISGLVRALWKVELPLWLSESPAVEIINTVQEFTLGTQWKSALCWWLCLKPWSNKISFIYKTYSIKVSALPHIGPLKAISSIFKKGQVWWFQNILSARTLRFWA